jgi:hypothetical protein
MKLSLSLVFAVALLATSALAQKGIDTQTEKIKDDSNKVISRENDVTRSFSWGKGKTRTRPMLANPYKLNSRRDALLESIADTLRDDKIVIDEAASRPQDGIIVTMPFVFAKGPVTTPSTLSRYAAVPEGDSTWSRAQYTLTIEVQSIDGVQNNVSVNAKVEGRAGNGLGSEWRSLQSTGLAEDEFLAKLVEAITGTSPDPKQDEPKL